MSRILARCTAIIFLATSALPLGCMTAQPAGPALINASDEAAVAAAMPTVTVVGVVDKVNDGESTLTINFKDTQHSHFYAVILRDGRDALNTAFGGNVAKALTPGETLHVTGKVTLYHGRPEIIISNPDQLVVAK